MLFPHLTARRTFRWAGVVVHYNTFHRDCKRPAVAEDGWERAAAPQRVNNALGMQAFRGLYSRAGSSSLVSRIENERGFVSSPRAKYVQRTGHGNEEQGQGP